MQDLDFTHRLREAGAMKGGDALHPASTATSVRVRHGKTETMDGSFAETKEPLGRDYLMDCADLDEAIRWAAQIPGAPYGMIDLRPVVVFRCTRPRHARPLWTRCAPTGAACGRPCSRGRGDRPAPGESPDERLRRIFTCCHPALDPKSRVVLTLRTLGGLTTPESARAFLDRETTMGQRLRRARHPPCGAWTRNRGRAAGFGADGDPPDLQRRLFRHGGRWPLLSRSMPQVPSGWRGPVAALSARSLGHRMLRTSRFLATGARRG